MIFVFQDSAPSKLDKVCVFVCDASVGSSDRQLFQSSKLTGASADFHKSVLRVEKLMVAVVVTVLGPRHCSTQPHALPMTFTNQAPNGSVRC